MKTLVIFIFTFMLAQSEYLRQPNDMLDWQWREYNRQQEERRLRDRDAYQNYYMQENLRLQRQQNEILQQRNQDFYWDSLRRRGQ